MVLRAELAALHLCSGYGGFELGLRLAGVRARTVAHVERDAYAAATLVARMEEAHLDLAPVWSDLTTFDGAAWRGRVDLVTAGLPCQPFSGAGAGAGRDDERHLWPMAQQLIADVGPRLVFLENVPDVVLPKYRWLEHVLCDLASLGFDAEWGVLSAGEVGAPHERERFWLLGYARGERRPEVRRSAPRHEGADGRRAHGDHISDRPGEGVVPELGDSNGGRLEAVGCVGGSDAARLLGDAHGPRARVGEHVPATESQGHARLARVDERAGTSLAGPADGGGGVGGRAWPPRRKDWGGWRSYIAQGGPEPVLRRVADGRPLELADALHLGGNGLLPPVAGRAFVELADRLGVDLEPYLMSEAA